MSISAAANAQAAERYHAEHAVEANAAQFAHAAERLYVASRAWSTIQPCSRAEIDAIGMQVEGLRHSLIGLRQSIAQK